MNDAVDSLNRAISFNTRASSYYYVLAGLYRRLGKVKESQEALEVFTRLDKESNELEKMRRSVANPAPTPAQPRGQREVRLRPRAIASPILEDARAGQGR